MYVRMYPFEKLLKPKYEITFLLFCYNCKNCQLMIIQVWRRNKVCAKRSHIQFSCYNQRAKGPRVLFKKCMTRKRENVAVTNVNLRETELCKTIRLCLESLSLSWILVLIFSPLHRNIVIIKEHNQVKSLLLHVNCCAVNSLIDILFLSNLYKNINIIAKCW